MSDFMIKRGGVTLRLDGRWAKGVDPARSGGSKAAPPRAHDLERAFRRTAARAERSMRRLEQQWSGRATAPSHSGRASPMEPAIERRVKASLAGEIKSGAAAQGCRYRFKALPYRAPDGGRDEFAIAVLALTALALGSLKWAPALRWYAAAGPGEKADYGADDWNGYGFMEPEDGAIWVHDNTPINRLAEVIAHEACHAIKHRGQANSIENEAEACAFGDRFGGLFYLPDYSGPEIFVVESGADLPHRAPLGSRAWAKGELALYSASTRGTPRSPRWFCEWRLDGAMNVYQSARGSAAVAWIEEQLDRHVPRSE